MAIADDIVRKRAHVLERIALSCRDAGRDPESVELVAVSKAQPEEKIRAAYDAGQRVFGENYAQELAQKASALRDLPAIRWRFIGHLQRNKIKLIEGARATVDTVDSFRLASAISARAEQGDHEAEVLLQVNVGAETQKSGCTVTDLPNLVEQIRSLPRVTLCGLMTVAPHFDEPNDAREVFATLRRLAVQNGLAALSMGMTHDMEPAIAEGATMVRVGTGIFGERG